MTRILAGTALSAIVTASLVCSAAAAATFTFADAQGNATCSVIRLEQSAGIAGGFMDNTNCHPASLTRGSGLQTHVLGQPGRVDSFSYNQGRNTILFLINEKALTWTLYFAGPGGTGLVPQEVNSGVLLPGRVDARAPGANALAAQLAR